MARKLYLFCARAKLFERFYECMRIIILKLMYVKNYNGLKKFKISYLTY